MAYMTFWANTPRSKTIQEIIKFDPIDLRPKPRNTSGTTFYQMPPSMKQRRVYNKALVSEKEQIAKDY